MNHSGINKVLQSAVGGALPSPQPYDIARINAVFQRANARAGHLRLLMLSTSDGRAVTEYSEVSADGRRVAAMANSFLTLGETVTRELGLSKADYATICTAQGHLVMIRIAAAKPLTLMALGAPEINLGALLFCIRECAQQIEEIVRVY